jgi:hypothetical protein
MLSSAVPAVVFMPTFVPFFMAYAIQVRAASKLAQKSGRLQPFVAAFFAGVLT